MCFRLIAPQEYYDEEDITELYRHVLERLLLTLDDDEDTKTLDVKDATAPGLVIHEERLRVWPPWPWPPWDGDGDDKDGEDKKPLNRTEEAYKLSTNIVKLEKKIANASLDLCVKFPCLYDPYSYHSQGRPPSGSHCYIQPCSSLQSHRVIATI